MSVESEPERLGNTPPRPSGDEGVLPCSDDEDELSPEALAEFQQALSDVSVKVPGLLGKLTVDGLEPDKFGHDRILEPFIRARDAASEKLNR